MRKYLCSLPINRLEECVLDLSASVNDQCRVPEKWGIFLLAKRLLASIERLEIRCRETKWIFP